MVLDLEKYLLEAVGKSKEELSKSNPYRELGFDKEKNRLGWLKVYKFEDIKKNLENIFDFLFKYKYFVFVGMGGSINGVALLISLFKNNNLYTINSLDPLALKEVISKIDIKDTLVIPISKSGSTLETQLISLALKDLFKESYKEHFLWLSDPTAFSNLDSLGWQDVKKIPIQFDCLTDIGGRFSCPNTLIFFLTLFLLLKGDFNKLEKIYNKYISLQDKIRKMAYNLSKKYSSKKNAYFYIKKDKNTNERFLIWLIQLFQESLGSKKKNLSLKTLYYYKEKFLSLRFNINRIDKVVLTMARMYFFEVFIAFYSAMRKINFVTQDYVEEYKKKMREIKEKNDIDIPKENLLNIICKTKDNIKLKHKFIEIVLYCHPDKKILNKISNIFNKEFKDRTILIFTGSDWNHHSYQAAFLDKETFYIFLLPSSYISNIDGVCYESIKRNIDTLKIIAKASHISLKDKSLLFSFL